MSHPKRRKRPTPKQLAANRANAKLSTGPRTPEGKLAVRYNALKHGITMANPILSTENQADFDAAYNALLDEYQPRTPNEHFLFNAIVTNIWEQRRLAQIATDRLELAISDPNARAGFDHLTGHALTARAFSDLEKFDAPASATLERQKSRLDRQFHRFFNLYQNLHGPLNANPEIKPNDESLEAPETQKLATDHWPLATNPGAPQCN